MSQLYPVNFILSTQSIYIEQTTPMDNSNVTLKNSTIVFRPIIPKVLTKNVLSATVDNLQQMSNSNTNSMLTNNDLQDSSSGYNHLSNTYRSLAYVVLSWKMWFWFFSPQLINSSSFESADLPVLDDDIPMHSLLFSVCGSTYRRRINPSTNNTTSDRFRLCVTVPILEHLHDVNSRKCFLIDELLWFFLLLLDFEINR